MDQLSRITLDPAVMGGKPCIRGLRVTVATIIGLLAAGRGRDEILRAYPYLEPEDIDQALAYRRACDREAMRIRIFAPAPLHPTLPRTGGDGESRLSPAGKNSVPSPLAGEGQCGGVAGSPRHRAIACRTEDVGRARPASRRRAHAPRPPRRPLHRAAIPRPARRRGRLARPSAGVSRPVLLPPGRPARILARGDGAGDRGRRLRGRRRGQGAAGRVDEGPRARALLRVRLLGGPRRPTAPARRPDPRPVGRPRLDPLRPGELSRARRSSSSSTATTTPPAASPATRPNSSPRRSATGGGPPTPSSSSSWRTASRPGPPPNTSEVSSRPNTATTSSCSTTASRPATCRHGTEAGSSSGDRTIPEGAPVVTFVARSLDHVRGFDRFAAIVERLQRDFPDLIAVAAGNPVVDRALDHAHFGRRLPLASSSTAIRRSTATASGSPARSPRPTSAASWRGATSTSSRAARTRRRGRWSRRWPRGASSLAFDTEAAREFIDDGRNGGSSADPRGCFT